MRNPLENIEIPYSCSLCGLCQRICKYDLYPGGMCHEARVRVFQPLQERIPPDDFIYDFLTPRLKGIRNHQIFSSSPVFALNRGPEEHKGTLPKRVFFPGCSFPAYAPGLVWKAYQYLQAKMPGIGVVLNCCGKPSKDMGDLDRFGKIFDNTMNEFARHGVEEVVLACINCHKTFRENSGIKLRTIYEIMAEEGLPNEAKKGSGEVTLHDSCPARHQPAIRQAIRTILSRLDYRVNEFRFNKEMTQCCGAGGCAATGNTALAGRHTRDRAAQARGTVVTYCAHCRERFSSQVPALHILDLVFGASYKKSLVEAHDGWQNWFVRWYLKRKLNRRIAL
ncbi:MAG: (Fe-S)-binding protein [Proteobacteria bacterium]|nr:(Fe-S)-binding protein [Pseudomonadota bacterium]MBU1714647.1 (Fe-S)-binding protein [Pseudomonadota bacterium]